MSVDWVLTIVLTMHSVSTLPVVTDVNVDLVTLVTDLSVEVNKDTQSS